MALSGPLVHSDRQIRKDQRLHNNLRNRHQTENFRTGISRIRHLMEAVSSPTVNEACCQPFQAFELHRAMW